MLFGCSYSRSSIFSSRELQPSPPESSDSRQVGTGINSRGRPVSSSWSQPEDLEARPPVIEKVVISPPGFIYLGRNRSSVHGHQERHLQGDEDAAGLAQGAEQITQADTVSDRLPDAPDLLSHEVQCAAPRPFPPENNGAPKRPNVEFAIPRCERLDAVGHDPGAGPLEAVRSSEIGLADTEISLLPFLPVLLDCTQLLRT